MLLVRMALALGASAVLVLGGNLLLRIWLRRGDGQFGAHVWIAVAVLSIAAVWSTAFIEILTIMDEVWPQVAIVLVQGAATVVLTFALGRYGVFGALLAIAIPPVAFTSWVVPRLARGLLARLDPSHPARPQAPRS